MMSNKKNTSCISERFETEGCGNRPYCGAGLAVKVVDFAHRMQQCEMLCFEKPNRVVKTDIVWRQSIGALFELFCTAITKNKAIGEMSNVMNRVQNESFLKMMLFQNANKQGIVWKSWAAPLLLFR